MVRAIRIIAYYDSVDCLKHDGALTPSLKFYPFKAPNVSVGLANPDRLIYLP